MKKILIAVALCATIVSCSDNKLYFAEVKNCTVNDATAEFDTLSYAVGMNYALGFKMQMPFMDVDFKEYADAIQKTLENGYQGFEAFALDEKQFTKFNRSHIGPYASAYRRNQMMPNDSIEMPILYDEEFTREKFAELYARLNAGMLLTYNTPFNSHYITMALKDATALGEIDRTLPYEAIDSLFNATFKLPQDDARSVFTRFNNILAENMAKDAEQWFKGISSKRNVQIHTIGEDTIYYRINSPGGVKPTLKDSVSVNYAVYSYRGRLIESSDSRIKQLREAIETVKADTTMRDSIRNVRLNMMNEQMAKLKDQIITLDQFRIPAIKSCLPLVGEFGSITLWVPSKFAPRTQMLLPNEPVVITVELNDVIEGAVIPQALPMKGGAPKVAPQNVPTARKAVDGNGKTITLTPVKGNQEKPESK